MSAIPRSSLPGHKQLHERVVSALDVCQETQDIDFKESGAWEGLKYHIARTSMAMANLRDGGVIVIGVSERENKWTLEGVQNEHLVTYSEDEVNDFVNRYASPSLRVELVLVEHRDKVFLAIKVPEFSSLPIICKRDMPQKLKQGAIYIRAPGKPETTQANDATDISALLELAAEKRAKEIISVSHRIGMVPAQPDKEAFDAELNGL